MQSSTAIEWIIVVIIAALVFLLGGRRLLVRVFLPILKHLAGELLNAYIVCAGLLICLAPLLLLSYFVDLDPFAGPQLVILFILYLIASIVIAVKLFDPLKGAVRRLLLNIQVDTEKLDIGSSRNIYTQFFLNLLARKNPLLVGLIIVFAIFLQFGPDYLTIPFSIGLGLLVVWVLSSTLFKRRQVKNSQSHGVQQEQSFKHTDLSNSPPPVPKEYRKENTR